MPPIRRLVWQSFVFVGIAACVLFVFLALNGGEYVSNGLLLQDDESNPSSSAKGGDVRLDNYLRLYKYQQKESLSQFLPHNTCDLLVINRITSMCRDVDRYGDADGKWICGLHTSPAGIVHIVGEILSSSLENAIQTMDSAATIIKHATFTSSVASIIESYRANILVVHISTPLEIKAFHSFIANYPMSDQPPIDQVGA